MFVDNLPSKSEIFDYWKDRLHGLVRFIDWGEPSCWACGIHYGTRYDIKRSDAGWDAIFECWEAIPSKDAISFRDRSVDQTTHPTSF